MKTSLRDIADACGIQAGSLYHHFDSKEAIIVELVERYHADLDALADLPAAGGDDERPVRDRVVDLGATIAACAVRHRAALLLTTYEPPATASDALVRVAVRRPLRIEAAMAEILRTGRRRGEIRTGIDLDLLADRLCESMLHISLGNLSGVPGGEEVPRIKCLILLDGIAPTVPTDVELDRSPAFRAAEATIAAWDKAGQDEDERMLVLRSVARAEFGRRGYEATTVRHIAAAAGMSNGSVYRLIGSKDELLTSIMGSFTTKAQSGWRAVLRSDATTVEKLDALMWINVNAVDRFSDEFNIQLAWLRESPPDTADLGTSHAARLTDLTSLLAQGTRSGAIELRAPTSALRAWSLFELLWMPEGIVRSHEPRGALALARDTVLRGAATRR